MNIQQRRYNDDDTYDYTFRPFLCPTCKMELTEPTMHGWVRVDFGLQTNWRTRMEPCPTCADQARARRIATQTDRLLGQARIPFRMTEWSFTTVPPDVSRDAMQQAITFTNKKMEKRGLYLYGKEGQGKTGLAISIIQAVIRRGEDAVFVRSLDLMNRLRESIHRGTHEGDDLLKMIKEVTWLALDDLAVEKPTPYVIQELKAIVESRMDNGKYTVFTSNLSLNKLEDYWRPDDVPSGGFHAGTRVVARLGEYVQGVLCNGRNLRLVSRGEGMVRS